MRLAGGVFRRQEAHAQKGLHLAFDQPLQIALQRRRRSGQFGGGVVLEPEKLDIAHAGIS